MAKSTDISGNKYGRLKAIKRVGTSNSRVPIWECSCECGKTVNIIISSLKSGNTKSCGCIVNKHGSSNSRLYRIYKHMIERCYKEYCKEYKYYGGKGISVLKLWMDDFNSFKQWSIKNGYKENLSIDRIDPNGNYEPDNCQWITISENSKKMHRQNKKDGLPIGIYKRNYGNNDKFIVYSHKDNNTKYVGSFDNIKDAIRVKESA